MSAAPGKLPPALVARFAPEEIAEGTPARILPARLAEVREKGRLVAEGEHPFVMNRHLCEVADQWCFMETPCLGSAAREAMVVAQGGKAPELRLGMSRPLAAFDVEFKKPYFLLDQGTVRTQAYALEGGVAFVHGFHTKRFDKDPHAVALEDFRQASPRL
jgi:hypothetical protein